MKRGDLLTTMCRQLDDKVEFSNRAAGAMNFVRCAFEHYHMRPDMVKNIKTVSFTFRGQSNLNLDQIVYLIETLLAAHCNIKYMDFQGCASNIDSVEMGRVIQLIPHA